MQFAILLPPLSIHNPQIAAGILTLTLGDNPPMTFATPPTGLIQNPAFVVPDRNHGIEGTFAYVNADGLQGPSIPIGPGGKIPRPGAVQIIWLD